MYGLSWWSYAGKHAKKGFVQKLAVGLHLKQLVEETDCNSCCRCHRRTTGEPGLLSSILTDRSDFYTCCTEEGIGAPRSRTALVRAKFPVQRLVTGGLGSLREGWLPRADLLKERHIFSNFDFSHVLDVLSSFVAWQMVLCWEMFKLSIYIYIYISIIYQLLRVSMWKSGNSSSTAVHRVSAWRNSAAGPLSYTKTNRFEVKLIFSFCLAVPAGATARHHASCTRKWCSSAVRLQGFVRDRLCFKPEWRI